MPSEPRRPLLVVDGDSFAHRAYHALPKTIRRKGGTGGGAIVLGRGTASAMISKDALAAAVTRRYNERIAKAVDQEVKAGTDVVQAWLDVFRGALTDGTRMCLCGALGVTLRDLSPEVVAEVKRFFDLAIDSLVSGGLSRKRAMQVLAILEGAILMASVRGDVAPFDEATAALR